MIAGPSRLVLLGNPVSHSLSPLFQNAALRSEGIDLSYDAIEVAAPDLRHVLTLLAEDNAAGNITIPHKEAAVALCARLSPLAERIGAVNTFWVERDGAIVGDNTDVGGFESLVRSTMDGLPRGRIALLGAGGAAAAALAAIEQWPGCEVTLYNRSHARLARLASRFPVVTRTAETAEEAVQGAKLVVNASASGLEDDLFPVPIETLPYDAAVVDLVYRRGDTPWVRAALACGHRASDGLPMLIEQGALSFEKWFGRPAPRAIMWDAVTMPTDA
ncbi:MAG: shikimate dehydrogenase family protein [Gemmatimonadales bacterium]